MHVLCKKYTANDYCHKVLSQHTRSNMFMATNAASVSLLHPAPIIMCMV